MKYRGYIWKRRIENVLMYPFILLGRLLALLDPLPREYRVFYFFPFYHTGGAEKIHAAIAKATGGDDAVIFFTRHSGDDRFLHDFKSSGCQMYDISRYVDVTWLYFLKFIWRGKISGFINGQRMRPVIFNGQSNFGYKLSPWIRHDIRQVELIHSFNSFSWIRIPFLSFIDATVMISRVRIQAHLEQYRQLGIPAAFGERIHYIANAIEWPSATCSKNFSKLKLLFVGRGTPEKRPELFIELAREAAAAGIDADFTLTGEMPASLIESLPSNVTATGNINDPQKLEQLYCTHNVLMIPSETEGFPLVLMEAMAGGCVAIATPVGDIPYHINERNGKLLSSIDADKVISESLQWMKDLRLPDLALISANAKTYALQNFGIGTFNQQYQSILQP